MRLISTWFEVWEVIGQETVTVKALTKFSAAQTLVARMRGDGRLAYFDKLGLFSDGKERILKFY
jgi:hypothetical protein